MLTLPNFLTLLRIVAIPAFLILVSNHRYAAGLVLFMAAGVTDTVDGVLARLTNAKSELGATMDPLADKLLLLSSFVVLAWLDAIPSWLLILVLTRDVVILSGYLVIYFVNTPMEIDPTFVGKLNTFCEMFAIGFALLALARPDMPMATINLVTWYLTGATATISGVHYVYSGLLWYQRQGTTPDASK
ncbi:MAG: CDP-alcohol phosphatidyltransferase family protein [Candidatus Binatia bacterium]